MSDKRLESREAEKVIVRRPKIVTNRRRICLFDGLNIVGFDFKIITY